MKKLPKWLSKALIVLMALTLLTGSVIVYGATLPDFIPNTPIQFNNLYDALFSELHLSTGNITYPYEEGSWRYYYWCVYNCQYNADYTIHVNHNGRKAMEVQLYDADGTTMLAEDKGTLTRLETGRYNYNCEITYSLTEGHKYYYRIAFSEHYLDSCGDFTVSLVSTPGNRITSDENILLQIGNYEPYTYDIDEYSRERLRNDLTFIAIYTGGVVDRWYGSENPTGVPTLRGCYIMFDYSDCAATVGEHTITAHYMGRSTSKTFYITGCEHQYNLTSQTERTWLKSATQTYKCDVCGKEYTSVTEKSGKELFADFNNHLDARHGERNYSADFDLNKDQIINVRDFSILYSIFDETKQDFNRCLNLRRNDKNYKEEYDLNGDGIINMRDYVILYSTKTHM